MVHPPEMAHKTCLRTFGCMAYIFNRGVDASQANILKKSQTLPLLLVMSVF